MGRYIVWEPANGQSEDDGAKVSARPAVSSDRMGRVEGRCSKCGHDHGGAAPATDACGGLDTPAAIETAPKPLDDQRLQQQFGDAIEGALAFGYQGNNPPPEGHWLTRFWNLGRAQATSETDQKPAAWMRDSGTPHDKEACAITAAVKDLLTNVDPQKVTRYTIPLYASPLKAPPGWVRLEDALKVLPGGTHCDPQQIADDLRALAASPEAPRG